jgi:putative membrane protein
MKGKRKIWVVVALLGLAGISLLIFLLVRHGWSDILGAVAAGGWGTVAVVAFHIVPILTNSLAWYMLFRPPRKLGLRLLVWIRWLGEAVGTLLPATQVGGEVVRARLAVVYGAAISESAATVIADVTLGIGAQIIFTLGGLFLLARLTGRAGMTLQALVGAGIAVIVIACFFALQHFGMFRFASALLSRVISADGWPALKEHGSALDEDLRAVYQRHRDAIVSFFFSLLTWIAGAGEVWIALRVLGSSGGFAHALVLESVCQGVRAVMFLIPGALGVQEGGYVVVGGLLGIPAETSLALAMMRRLRELSFGVPGLIAWQWVEGRRLWRRRPTGSPTISGADASAQRS